MGSPFMHPLLCLIKRWNWHLCFQRQNKPDDLTGVLILQVEPLLLVPGKRVHPNKEVPRKLHLHPCQSHSLAPKGNHKICLCKVNPLTYFWSNRNLVNSSRYFGWWVEIRRDFFTDVEVPILVCSSPCLRTGTTPHVMIYWSFPSVVSWRVTSIWNLSSWHWRSSSVSGQALTLFS